MVQQASRRERERQRHRREILEAARELFARQSYERTNMTQIAARAEFAVGTLYKFFKDKRSLYRALIVDTLHELERDLAAALATRGSEVEKIERFVEAKCAVLMRHIPTARLYFTQTAGARYAPTAGLESEIREIYDKVLAALEAVFRAGVRKRVFAKLDPRALAIGLEGVSNAFIGAVIDNPAAYTAQDLADTIKQIFFERVRLTNK